MKRRPFGGLRGGSVDAVFVALLAQQTGCGKKRPRMAGCQQGVTHGCVERGGRPAGLSKSQACADLVSVQEPLSVEAEVQAVEGGAEAAAEPGERCHPQPREVARE